MPIVAMQLRVFERATIREHVKAGMGRARAGTGMVQKPKEAIQKSGRLRAGQAPRPPS